MALAIDKGQSEEDNAPAGYRIGTVATTIPFQDNSDLEQRLQREANDETTRFGEGCVVNPDSRTWPKIGCEHHPWPVHAIRET